MERTYGFGVRRTQADPALGLVDVLDVVPALATPEAEQAIRSRASRLLRAGTFAAPIHRVEREGATLRLTGHPARGVVLADVLSKLEARTLTLSAGARLEMAAAVVHAVAALHQLPGALAHGALTPAHIVLTPDGTAISTFAVFGPALERLQMNREQLWREFSLALPASATLPRFDQRSDVTQLGAVVLAIILARPLRADEYPRGIEELVMAATATVGSGSFNRSALRMWTQQAIQLHPRAVFASATDADRALSAVLGDAPARRAAQLGLHAAIGQLSGEGAALRAPRSTAASVPPLDMTAAMRPMAAVPARPSLRGIVTTS